MLKIIQIKTQLRINNTLRKVKMKMKKFFSFKVNLTKKIIKINKLQRKDNRLAKYKLISDKKSRIFMKINLNHNKSSNRSAIVKKRTANL